MSSDSKSGSSLQRNLREISGRQKISPALAGHLEHYFSDIDPSNFVEADLEALHGAAIQHHRLGLSRPARQLGRPPVPNQFQAFLFLLTLSVLNDRRC